MADLDLELLLKLEDRATGALNRSLGKVDKQTKQSTRNVVSLGRQLRQHWIAATIAIGGTLFIGELKMLPYRARDRGVVLCWFVCAVWFGRLR